MSVRANYAWPSRRSHTSISNCRRRRLGPAGILGFRAAVTPRVWGVSHTVQVELSLLPCSGVGELSNEGTFRFRPTSCEQRQKHSNDPLTPRMCQFLFANFYSNVDVSNYAQTSPCNGAHIRYVNGQSSAAPLGVCGAFFYCWPEGPVDQLLCLLRRALSLSDSYQLISRIRDWASPCTIAKDETYPAAACQQAGGQGWLLVRTAAGICGMFPVSRA